MYRLLAPLFVIALSLTGCEDSPPLPPAEAGEAASMPGTSTVDRLPAPNRVTPEESSSAEAKDPPPPPKPPENPDRAQFAGLVGPVPPTWQWQPPRHHFRVAQWMVPGRDGSEPAELVVTTFPEASGNTVANNLERWARQFRTTDGSPSKPEVESLTVHEMPVTIADYSGEYLGMGGGWHKEGYRMIVAIVESPSGSVFLKLLGPDATVSANADGYRHLVMNLEVDEASP